MAEQLGAADAVTVLNDVVLNQALIRLTPPAGVDPDAFTGAVIERIRAGGDCWLGGTTWNGRAAIRISVSNWTTTEADIDRSARAILDAIAAEASLDRHAASVREAAPRSAT